MKYIIKVTEPLYVPNGITVLQRFHELVFASELTVDQVRNLGYDAKIESVTEANSQNSNFRLT